MAWSESILDVVLVPSGLLVLLLYHGQLAYRIWKHPNSTVIGVNDLNRRVWVCTMMSDSAKNGVLSVQTLRNNIMASTLLATAAITLSSLIAVLITNKKSTFTESPLVLGDQGDLVSSLKLLAVLVCFLAAFFCNVQAVRYYCHASFLLNIPLGDTAPGLTPVYVNRAITRGTHFWSLGLRAFYFSFPLFLWLFGPIPMFVCSVIMAVLLHFLDTAKDFNKTLYADGLPDS
ncbi:hypothetical protein KP509_19G050900 [Ceratopteris richardii]|uniref:DUF599 domain-containing protein n=2 Tax=Ceratopteris richardii TaxID=49495 RepID=A0A8T2SKI7_CERRI|nr:hypothetical protein KP509_19G050900 [Ceratopteris richardii]